MPREVALEMSRLDDAAALPTTVSGITVDAAAALA